MTVVAVEDAGVIARQYAVTGGAVLDLLLAELKQ